MWAGEAARERHESALAACAERASQRREWRQVARLLRRWRHMAARGTSDDELLKAVAGLRKENAELRRKLDEARPARKTRLGLRGARS